MLSNRKSRRAGQTRPNRAGFGATVEAFEKRELLTGVGPFIQGTAFLDSSGTGTFTGSDAPLPGATISLYQGTTVSQSTFLESTTTDSNGNYLFFNNGQGGSDGIAAPVAGQTYTVVETAPSGYTLTSAQAISQLDVASVNSTSKSIQVTVAASEVTTTYNGPGNLDYLIGYSLNGNTESTYVAPILITLSGTNVNPNQFATYCVDPLDNIGSVPYKVVTDPTTGLNPNGGKIGYLYNQYGGLTLPSTLPSGIQGQSYTAHEIQAGLQIAIWELEYPSSGSNPGFVLNQSGTSDYTNIQAIANAFITAANNAYSEQVGILDASLSGSVPSTTPPGQSPQIGQSLLAGESLNFGNNVSGSINGFDYLVSNTNQSATGLSGSTPNVPVVGTTVELFSGNSTTGTPLATTTTGSDGSYSFPNLPLGVYSVLEVAPTSDSHLGQTSSTTGATTSAGSSVTGITLSPTSPTSAENFFETVSVSVNGTDFLVPVGTMPTTSTTGTGLGGTSITITGTDEFGNVVNQTVNTSVTTGSSLGTYSFAGLNPSNAAGYAVTETIPSAYAHIGQTSTTAGAVYSVTGTPSSVSKVVLTPNGATSTDNFFEYGAAISGTAYVDNNGNDTFDTGDTGLGGVTVALYNGAGNAVIATTTTAPNGTYSFNNLNLPAGQYNLLEFTPGGYTGETPNPGISGGNASNVPSIPGEFLTSIQLGAGVSDTGNNFGQYQPGSLSGIVYVDATNSGSYVGTDAPLSGITLTLETTSRTVITTTTTSSTGAYSFTGLTPGSYKVVEGTVTGYGPDKTNTGSLTPVVVTSGANTPNNNFGEIGLSSISGTVYVDATGIGLTTAGQPAGAGDTPESGVTVTLTEPNGTKLTAVTGANGTYSFTGLPYGTYGVAETVPSNQYQTGPAALTYSVTTTSAAPNSTNDNFSNYMACNMSGVAAYYFTVTTPSGVSTNVTDLRGNTAPGDTVTAYFSIAPGSTPVMLSLVAYQAPTSYYSPSNVSQQVITSVATGTYGPGNYSETVTLPNSFYQVDFVCGAALAQLEANGGPTDYQYEHRLISADNGGTQPYALSSISGTVFVDSNANDKLDGGEPGIGGVQVFLYNAAGTQRLATATTDANGNYSFPNVTPGIYQLAEFTPGGYTGENPNAGIIGGSVSYSTTSGLAVIGAINLNSNTSDTGNNFGAYQPGSLSGVVYVDAGNTGSYVSSDTPLSGITLTLETTSGSVITTTTTSSTGTYSFTGLTPGSYKVVEGSVSATYSPDKTNTGSLSPIVVTSGTNTPNNNFGEILAGTDSISGTKYLDTTGNGLSCNQGPLTGDVPEAGVTIDLFSSTGTLIASTVTAANGTYSFTGLPNGTYKVSEVLPTGSIQTGPTVVTGPNSSPSLGDCNFDQVCVGSGWYGFQYNTGGDSWTFGGQSGLAGNGSAFTAGNPNSPSGSQVAFLQGTGCISQVVSAVTDGWYQFDFSDAKRGNGGGNQNFEILCDGNIVGTFAPSSTSYQACATPSFYLGSGSHTICIQGLDSCGGDNTAFLDKCSLVANTGYVTEQSNGQAYYTVTVSTSTPTSTNNNFSNYAACNTSAISNVSYKVTSTSSNWWGGCTTTTSGPYSTLSGNTNPGSTVSATFTVTGSTSQMVSLVSYIVPYSGAPLSAQSVFSLDSGTFTPGTHTVSVTLPTSAYQVDFVCGAAITQFGPSNSNVSYHGENRFFSSDTDGSGCQSYTTPPLANVQSDIGSVGTPGTVAYNNGSYTLTASGADFWGSADSGNYVYQTLNGNGEIVAKVDSISNTDSWAKAGLMIRQSLDAGSAQASVFATAGNGVVFQDRETAGGQSNSWSASNSYGCSANSGVWLKLVREGNTITSYDSSNGVSWTQVGSDTINMSQPVYIGLAATAHNNCAVATATFDNVSTSGYWASCSGQSLIESFGGWSGSTCLSTWLAQNYGNLYGSNAGCDNLWGQNNAGVAAFCQSLEAQYGAESLEYQTLSTAIDMYASNWGLGGSIACNWGFDCNQSVASQWENTSGSCSAFGTSTSNPWASVGSLLSFENSQSSCGTLYAGNTGNHQLACNVIYQVGCCW